MLQKVAQQPFHVMAKPAGSACNLACTYCYYLEKGQLYSDAPAPRRMSPQVLRSFIRQYIEAQPHDIVRFAWQGGEPTLLGVEFFESVVSLQNEYANGKTIENALQTNGTRLDARWGAFLKEHAFLVGISIDGPPKLHDRYRYDRLDRPSSDSVLRGLEVLKKHHIAFNTLTVVNRDNAKRPMEVYRYLRGLGARHLQFIPLVERLPDARSRDLGLSWATPLESGETGESTQVTRWSVGAKDFGTFLTAIFERWVRHDVGRIFVQQFDEALGKWCGAPAGMCTFMPTCGRSLALEHNGDLYSCDHYVYPGHKLGNILEQPMAELVDAPAQQAFGQAKQATLPGTCQRCPVLPLCHGDCPKHRFVPSPEGDGTRSYLCPSYRQFHQQAAPYFQEMARLLRLGQPATRIMEQLGRN